MSHTVLQPEVTDGGTGTGRWMVVIFNNDTNTVDEVVEILVLATSCSRSEAEIETWEAHHYGKAPVHFGSRQECEGAATLISGIGVKTEVSLEWSE